MNKTGVHKVVTGKDEHIRYNPMAVLIIYFGKTKLLVGKVVLDLLNQNEYVGETNEFTYADINDISIQNDENDSSFVINVNNEEKIKLLLLQNLIYSEESEKVAENVVNGFRKLSFREAIKSES